jgi:anti-anti-sigma regulatory factor
MKTSDVLIAHNSGGYLIKIVGRANFEYAPPLRNLANELENDSYSRISVNLKECTGMDSTFMGILAMIGLRAKKSGAEMEILNASDSNKYLLKGLGLTSLFSFSYKNTEDMVEWTMPEASRDKLDTAEAVVDAHDTLMDVTPENIPKFKSVVNFARKDLEKLKGGK